MAIAAPPSTGKTITISGSVALATQDLLNTTLHDIWGLAWATPSFTSNLMIVAVALAGLVLHRNQRSMENAELEKQNAAGATGGPGA